MGAIAVWPVVAIVWLKSLSFELSEQVAGGVAAAAPPQTQTSAARSSHPTQRLTARRR